MRVSATFEGVTAEQVRRVAEADRGERAVRESEWRLEFHVLFGSEGTCESV